MPESTIIRWSTIVDTLDEGIERATQHAATVIHPSIAVNTVNINPETNESQFEIIVIGTPPTT